MFTECRESREQVEELNKRYGPDESVGWGTFSVCIGFDCYLESIWVITGNNHLSSNELGGSLLSHLSVYECTLPRNTVCVCLCVWVSVDIAIIAMQTMALRGNAISFWWISLQNDEDQRSRCYLRLLLHEMERVMFFSVWTRCHFVADGLPSRGMIQITFRWREENRVEGIS